MDQGGTVTERFGIRGERDGDRGVAVDAHGKAKAALAVGAAVHRSDFDLTTELRQESGEPGSGPDVEIHADVEAFRRT